MNPDPSAPKYRTGCPFKSNADNCAADAAPGTPTSNTNTTPGFVTATAVGDDNNPISVPGPAVYATSGGRGVPAGCTCPNRPESVWIAATRPDECNPAPLTGNRNCPTDTDSSHFKSPVAGSTVNSRS